MRTIRILARAAIDKRRPLLVQMIAIRRCNLACGYCNEYDDHSSPVATEVMLERIRLIEAMGTAVGTFSGGEPLLHPDLDLLIRRVHDSGMIATVITNGYKLGPDRIDALNAARLDHLQISIDNVQPDTVSSKSLRVLDRKLVALAEHASFSVNINCVIGAGVTDPADALTISQRAQQLGFTCTLGFIHDGEGRLKPLAGPIRETYEAFKHLNRWSITRLNRSFQHNLAEGLPNDWRCRAGSRYLYVCENGLVHYCSQRRGTPGIPLGQYSEAHILQAHAERKACAPYCTLSCVHQASLIDSWHSPQNPVVAEARTGASPVASAPGRVFSG